MPRSPLLHNYRSYDNEPWSIDSTTEDGPFEVRIGK